MRFHIEIHDLEIECEGNDWELHCNRASKKAKMERGEGFMIMDGRSTHGKHSGAGSMNTKVYLFDDGAIKDKKFNLYLTLGEKFVGSGRINIADYTRDEKIECLIRDNDKKNVASCKV